MQNFVFDEENYDLQTILDVYSGGGQVLCPKCGTNLTIVLSRAEAKKTGISPGIVCPNDKRHVQRAFILQEDFLGFDKWFQEMQKEKKSSEQ
jgi:hypothetical protein